MATTRAAASTVASGPGDDEGDKDTEQRRPDASGQKFRVMKLSLEEWDEKPRLHPRRLRLKLPQGNAEPQPKRVRLEGDGGGASSRNLSLAQGSGDIAPVHRLDMAGGLARLGERDKGLGHVVGQDLAPQEIAGHILGFRHPAR